MSMMSANVDPGFLKAQARAAHSIVLDDSNGMVRSKKKLKALKKILLSRMDLMKQMHDIKSSDARDFLQKAKIQWAIEGDENSKFFYGIINRKRANLSIRGVMVDGEWVDNPNRVKEEFSSHFATRFQASVARRNLCVAVEWFFDHSSFTRGCNSSFISLILKVQDPKFVNDYRPISLIGSLYKVVTKILATRLSFIISDLISDVQTAFLPNRQILDGPFIINELLSWCKHKKQQTMVFKVDFAKAYDSIRWDYLDDVLQAFSFGSRWPSWINELLKRVSLRVLRLITPITISHLFYADDAVFVGEWSDDNLTRIMQVLHCFSLSSGLKINVKKKSSSRSGYSKR
ncbi:RNA-directed DNA polymerase, eukaryota [Tanacetum coccineum]